MSDFIFVVAEKTAGKCIQFITLLHLAYDCLFQ